MAGEDTRRCDIFVSYAATDNDRPAPHGRWVTRFTQDLVKLLTALLGGERPLIYFDQATLNANHSLDEILTACRRSEIFIAVSSPAYHRRPWTARELTTFEGANPDLSGLFLVEIDPTLESERLPQFANRHIRTFSETRPEDAANTPIPLKIGEDPFYAQLSRLAHEIAGELRRRRAPAAALSKIDQLGPVLLAQVTEDLEDEREAVRDYLGQFGVAVLPREDYPQGGTDFRTAVSEDMEHAKLFVQLLGRRPGRVPRDLAEGYARAQMSVAQMAKTPILQWRRPDLDLEEVNDAEHRAFLSGSEVMVSTLEQFKAEVVKRLQAPPVAPRARPDFLVFVNAELADRDAAESLRERLGSKYTVALPVADAVGSIRDDVTESIRDCDAMLLVYGESEPTWVRAQLRHARKARAERPPVSGAVCSGPPSAKPELAFSMPGIESLNCISSDSTWNMEPVFVLLARLAR